MRVEAIFVGHVAPETLCFEVPAPEVECAPVPIDEPLEEFVRYATCPLGSVEIADAPDWAYVESVVPLLEPVRHCALELPFVAQDKELAAVAIVVERLVEEARLEPLEAT